MNFGINLGGVAPNTPEATLIDRMRMASDVMPSTGNPAVPVGPCDPVTALPTGPGAVPRLVPLDPGTHDYVALFDANVSRLFVNGAVKPPVIAGNRATFTVALPDGSIGAQHTIMATGPVKQFSVMRAEHEAAFLKGEIFNPDFLGRVAPFKSIRALDWHGTNADAYPAARPLPSNPYFYEKTGGFPHEFGAMLASRTGAKLWSTIHHLMTDQQIGEALHAMDAAAGGSRIELEWSNEFGWTYHRTWAYAQAGARYSVAKPATSDMLRYYGFRAGSLANIAGSVSKRFGINLSAQPSSQPDKVLAAILAGWDEAKAPRSLIAGFANEGYIDFNYPQASFAKLLQLQQANDVDGFYAFAQSLVPALAGSHKAAAVAAAAVGIPYKIYEYNASIYSQAPAIADATARAAFIAWMAPIAHSDRMADIVMQAAQAAADAGAIEGNLWQLSGAGSQYGFWGAMPHVSLAAYPIYDRLMKVIAPAAMSSDSLAAISADLAAVADRLSAFAGTAPPQP
jgi:hypothetical protein